MVPTKNNIAYAYKPKTSLTFFTATYSRKDKSNLDLAKVDDSQLITNQTIKEKEEEEIMIILLIIHKNRGHRTVIFPLTSLNL